MTGSIEEQRRDLELGAALAALPHPELPDDMDARLRAAIEVERRRRRRRRSIATLGLAATLAAIVLGGAALAGAFDSDSPAPWPEPPLPAESVYPTNAAGQTFGGDKPLVEGPDLVKVMATNGKQGYCLQAISTGTDAITPRSARRGRRAQQARHSGATPSPSTSPTASPRSGSSRSAARARRRLRQRGRWQGDQTADSHGNIITTTVTPDGTATIETEALDGTVTTKTLTGSRGRRLMKKAAANAAAGSHSSTGRPPGCSSACPAR